MSDYNVPKGWKLVPEEPAREMFVAANKADDKAYAGGCHHGADNEDIWHAMLAAAPAAPEPAPAIARGFFHALPEEDDYEFHDEKYSAGTCEDCVPAVIVPADALSAVTAERDKLRAEVEVLRKDAERYSLLASMVVAECAGAEMTPQQAALFGSLNAITRIRTTAEFDAVFDAAMAAKEGE